MLCPHCAREIVTPVYDVNPTLLNPVGAGGAQIITIGCNPTIAQTSSLPIINNINSAACVPCQPIVTGTFVMKP